MVGSSNETSRETCWSVKDVDEGTVTIRSGGRCVTNGPEARRRKIARWKGANPAVSVNSEEAAQQESESP
jgi:hypothetical protein